MAADFLCEIIDNREIARDIFNIKVRTDASLPDIKAGQFAHIAVPEFFLRRPVSIAGYEPDKNKNKNQVEFIVQAVGNGTKKLASLKAGSELKILMPLGRPFPVDNIADNIFDLNLNFNIKNIWLASGGIGLAPILFCAEQIFNLNKKNKKINIESFAGFRDEACVFGLEKLKKFGGVNLNIGGIITDLIADKLQNENINKPDYIFACGPKAFLSALKNLCEKYNLKCYASLEEAMGCGIGACLTCSCKIKNKNQDIERYMRVCRDGPVFELDSVIF